MRQETDSDHNSFELGLFTLSDIAPDPRTGKMESESAGKRLKEIVAAAKLADEAGLDVFGVGEHHRLDYAVSSPPVVLAAIAQATKQIKLTSATTVLSTVDPVRLFEDFATLDLLSDGRAEIIAGRGAFIESYPLFGYDTADYDALFAEHLDLLLKLNKQETITWYGQFRPSLYNAEISPRPVQEELPIWVGVGGTTESAVRAGRLGTGMALALLGGDPVRFKPLVDNYRQSGIEAGHQAEQLKVAVTGHGYFAKTTQQAKEEFYPHYAHYWSYVDRQRGMSRGRISQADFEYMAASDKALFVGSPQQIIEKILAQYELFGHRRFLAQIDIGGIPFKNVAEGIELLATEIAPVIRKEINERTWRNE